MGEQRLSINQWAEDDRPREKLERFGAEALSNAELLAILIGSGNPQESAVDLMKRLMSDCGNNLNRLGKMTVRELTSRYCGIGPAKAITILAAVELGRRRQLEEAEERPIIQTSADIYRIMRPLMRDLPTEEGWLMLLNSGNKLIKRVRISSGGLTETLADVRVIMKEALLSNATSIVFCHNHPSGNSRPSKHDDNMTRNLYEAGRIMRMPLADHVIITEHDFYSYNDENRLPPGI